MAILTLPMKGLSEHARPPVTCAVPSDQVVGVLAELSSSLNMMERQLHKLGQGVEERDQDLAKLKQVREGRV
jgi:hypothetical protein